MAQAQLDKFITFISNNPSALQEASQGTKDSQQLLHNLVQYANAHGYDFSEAEAKAWASEYAHGPAGELSDAQLDAVAGGGSAGDGVPAEILGEHVKQQKIQTIQSAVSAITNLSKAAHDIAASIIGNLRA